MTSYLGLNIALAGDCEPDENVLAPVDDYEDLFEAVDAGAPGIALDDGGWKIVDEPALRAWVEARLDGDEWAELHGERPDHVAEYDRERRAMDRDYYRAVL